MADNCIMNCLCAQKNIMKLHNAEYIIYSCHQRVLWLSKEGFVACITLLWETSSACYLIESTAVLNQSQYGIMKFFYYTFALDSNLDRN